VHALLVVPADGARRARTSARGAKLPATRRRAARRL
jgi:hypothetical protein